MNIGGDHVAEEAVKVLIVDDHRLILEVLQHALSLENSLNVDVATSYDEALEKIEKSGRFDVVLLDYQLPGILGLDALRNLNQKNDGNVAIFSADIPQVACRLR